MPIAGSEVKDAISGWQFSAADGLTSINAAVITAKK
jgi:hypothetical protein